MAIVAAELLARVSADTTRAQRDLSAFSRHLQDTTTGWNRMLTGAGKALGMAFGAAGGFAAFAGVTSLTGAVQSLVGEAADAYAYSERLRMSLSSMAAKEFLQSGQAVDMASALDMAAGRAQELEYWIRQVAIESPFDRRGVADAFRMAMTYGFTSEQAQRLTQATIDFSTATGQSGEVMQRIALALGQIQSRGKLAGQELNQLSEAGVNARQILADAFGVSTAKIMEMMERGLIPANVAIEAILSDMERNYAGAGKRAQESLMGVLNTLGDLKEARLEDLFGPTFASAVVPALSQLASIMQSPEFIGATKEIGKELGVWSALQLGGLSENVERIVAAINAGPDNTPTWMTALAALTGAQSTVTPRIGPPEAGEMPEVGFGELEIPVTAVLTSYRWEGAADGGHFEIEVDAKGNLTKIDLYGGETTGWDGGKFEGGRLVIDTDAQVVKIGYGAGADKDLLALKFTTDWREGSLVKLAAGAYNTVAAELAKSWTANVKLIPDISEILEVLSQPFQVVANFVTGNEEKTERTTESVSAPETPSAQLFYDPYSVKIELEPDTAALDSTLGADYSTTTTIDPDWGTTWQQIYTAKVDLQPIGPINVQVNPVIGGSHNFPRRPSSTVPSDILGSPGFAAGGTHSGGRAMVGELGPELAFFDGAWQLLGANGPQVVDLPAGVEIIPADKTRRLLAGGAPELTGALPYPRFGGYADGATGTAVAAKVAEGWQATVNAIIDWGDGKTEPPSEWAATIIASIDWSQIQFPDWWGNAPERTTETLPTPTTPDTMPIDVTSATPVKPDTMPIDITMPYDSYGIDIPLQPDPSLLDAELARPRAADVKLTPLFDWNLPTIGPINKPDTRASASTSATVRIEPDTAELDATLAATRDTTANVDADWGATWQQIYTAKVDLQPIGPINVQVNPVIGGSHNFPRRPSSIVPSDILGSPGFAAGGTHSGGLAVVGERGAELAFYGDAWQVLGANGPQLVDLPAGTEIIPADATRRMMLGGAPELANTLPIPGFASGTTPTPTTPDLKAAGEAATKGDWATYKALMGLTDAVEANTGAAKAQGEAMGGIHPGGRAMVGELGPELAFFDGAWQLLGANGPQVVDLPAGVEIIPADKTRRLLAGGAPELTGALPYPRFGGYADGATGTAPTPVSPDLKAAGAAAAAGDWATYKALMGLTDAVEANTGAAKAQGEAMGGIHPGGRAMVGELGPELAFFDGAWQLLGANGPQLVDLPAGTEIIPADATRRMMLGGAPELANTLPIPGFASGTTPTPTTPDLKAAGEAATKGDWATYKALMGLTDAVEANTGAAKAQSKALSELAMLLGSVEGLFGTSQVTAEQMELAELGVPQNFADDYLRRLTDEVMNGVDWEGVDIGDAAARAGIDPNLPAEAILSMFRSAWADSSLFADAQNLDLINQDAVQAALQRQRDSETGQANIMALFGIGEGDLVAQIQGLDLAGAFTSALGEDAMAPVGEAVVAGIGASVEGGAIEIADGLTSGYATALGTPEQQAALAALGEASLLAFAGGWRDAASSYDWAGALPTVTPTGSTTTGTGAVTSVTGVTDPTMLADGGYVARGGWAVVGERGPELAYLPSGTNVYDTATSRRGGGVNVTVNVTANTPLDWEVAAQRIGEIVSRKQRRR